VIRSEKNSSHTLHCMGSSDNPILLAVPGAGILTTMRRDHNEPAIRDLFSTEMVRERPPPKPTLSVQEPRPILPKNLPDAIKHLTDGELDRLLAASIDEAKRRGRLPPSFQTTPQDQSKRIPARRRAQFATMVSLTRGQMNAVFAAFKAGIKPSQIARQFGITRSDVHKVLRSDTIQRSISVSNLTDHHSCDALQELREQS
jgi:hypothetical protein